MQSVEVEIFGRRFRLKSDNPERTTRVADEINRQIEELNSTFDNLDFTKLLLLICLQQQEQVVLLEEKNNTLSTDIERLNGMISMILTDTP
ncbi:MAG: cell division protein ZapA [Candidatus Cloacimonetes bacterium]|nr:cell division protein ZapA [Candidatus Cloacimonadota bacterium]